MRASGTMIASGSLVVTNKTPQLGDINFVRPLTGSSDEFLTLFRGDQPGTTVIKSKAASLGDPDKGFSGLGFQGSQRVIDNNNLDDLFKAHSDSSAGSPFISLTSDRRVADFFAGPNGVVNEFKIPTNRATFNPHNNFSVPAGLNGSLIPESEFLVPNYIRPSEFVK